ncbi:MAG TPA: alpha/beta fold hydrolase [Vitreimonas sp.]|nr:alpha/beta fold hydrolase [Vitreimonas sp.]
MFEIVKTTTADKLLLRGLWATQPQNKTVVLHIHGYDADPFSNDFLVPTVKKLANQQVSVLMAQTRGAANNTSFKVADSSHTRQGGSHYELLKEAYLDIDAWVEFLIARGFKEIILSGHSLGTFKVTRYLFEGINADKINKLVLLAPFDKTGEIEMITKGRWTEYVEEARSQVAAGNGQALSPAEWGVVPLSYQSYISWYEPGDLSQIFDFYQPYGKFVVLNKIKIPVLMVVGDKDEYLHVTNPEHPEEAVAILQKNIHNFTGVLIPTANHFYEGHEQRLADEISQFVTKS